MLKLGSPGVQLGLEKLGVVRSSTVVEFSQLDRCCRKVFQTMHEISGITWPGSGVLREEGVVGDSAVLHARGTMQFLAQTFSANFNNLCVFSSRLISLIRYGSQTAAVYLKWGRM